MRSLIAALLLWNLCSPALGETCIASVYGTKDRDQNGTNTASGIPLNDGIASMAHNTWPLKTFAWVTNLDNGQSRRILVTDRGPHKAGRCVDFSVKAAKDIGCGGLCRVSVR